MEVDTEKLSPTTLCTQLAAYQNTIRDLHDQHQLNTELLGCLEAMVTKKEMEISRLRIAETEKDLRLEAQQCNLQNQPFVEQTAREQVSSTLEGLQQELEVIKREQANHKPMDISSSTDETSESNHAKQKAEEEKCLAEECLAKSKAEYEQVLRDKNHEITTEIECIKSIWKTKCTKNVKQHQKLMNIIFKQLCPNYAPLRTNTINILLTERLGKRLY